MELTKEQLETLSDCILNEMTELIRIQYSLRSNKTLSDSVGKEVDKLKNLNSIICNQLEKVAKWKPGNF